MATSLVACGGKVSEEVEPENVAEGEEVNGEETEQIEDVLSQGFITS
ncbi:hypothetical protein ACFPU1_04655 [Thalassorhabdus alkalitolerans]|uniref:Uncharacterized protein n=1 Tax=Thalassorhabdus alkalitolerans TaxID=2282697 RepID=A0ABW0YIB3_9BACI